MWLAAAATLVLGIGLIEVWQLTHPSTVQEFDQTVGDDMAQLDASSCVATFNLAFEQLAAEARRRVALRDALSPERLDPPPEEPPDEPPKADD